MSSYDYPNSFLYRNPRTGLLVKSSVPPEEGVEYAVVDYELPVNQLALVNGEAVVVPPRPTPWHILHGAEWIDTRRPGEAEAEAWVKLRLERDRLLLLSDWTDTDAAKQRLSPDMQNRWASYREALRDLPENTSDPLDPTWPEAPTE